MKETFLAPYKLFFDSKIASPNFKTIRAKSQSNDMTDLIISDCLFYFTFKPLNLEKGGEIRLTHAIPAHYIRIGENIYPGELPHK